MLHIRPAITCVDGQRLSVQASEYHYCTPRSSTGPYTHVEVMVFGSEVPEWQSYGDDEPGNISVYVRVPVPLVVEYIKQHGGVQGMPQEATLQALQAF